VGMQVRMMPSCVHEDTLKVLAVGDSRWRSSFNERLKGHHAASESGLNAAER